MVQNMVIADHIYDHKADHTVLEVLLHQLLKVGN
jgi:hypothetical protein